MKQFLEGNIPLKYRLNEETLFMSCQRFAIKEVNVWIRPNGRKIFFNIFFTNKCGKLDKPNSFCAIEKNIVQLMYLILAHSQKNLTE